MKIKNSKIKTSVLWAIFKINLGSMFSINTFCSICSVNSTWNLPVDFHSPKPFRSDVFNRFKMYREGSVSKLFFA